MKTIFSFTVVLAAIAAFSLANHFPFNAAAGAALAPPSGFVLVAHGGAGDYINMKPEQVEMRRAAMLKAVQAGYTILEKGLQLGRGGSNDSRHGRFRTVRCRAGLVLHARRRSGNGRGDHGWPHA